MGCFRGYETEERGLKNLNKMKTESPSKRESTTVCAKIVNTDWDLVVYSTSYQEGVLECVGLGSGSLGGILLLEKEISREGVMPLSPSSEEKTRRKRKIKGSAK